MEQKRGCKVFAGTRTFQVREIYGFNLYSLKNKSCQLQKNLIKMESAILMRIGIRINLSRTLQSSQTPVSN